jgi:Xaa-Pro dipeptidase
MGANFGIAGMDWQQRVNWDRLRKYRIERAREMMKKHGLGAMLCMYDENCRYITGTLTPGWNRLKPGLRYAMLCGDGDPVLFEQGDLGFHIERHSPWIPKENVRYSYAWIKGAAGPASTQQVNKFTDAIIYVKRHGVAGQKLGCDFIDINMINVFREKNIAWVDGMTPMMETRAVKSVDEQECMRIVGAPHRAVPPAPVARTTATPAATAAALCPKRWRANSRKSRAWMPARRSP